MLLHSTPVAEGWLRYLTAIRHECALPGALREMVIMRIAHLNGAPYEAAQHAPIALREGLSEAQVDALADWHASTLFDDTQRAVLAYCDAMTREIRVPAETFAAIRRLFDPREVVELTATIGAYNMVSRFLEALKIDHHGDMTAP
jgi:AhpD family alkylhydroperoxidase